MKSYEMEKVSCNNIVFSKTLKDTPIILKGQNGPIASADIAPVHSSASKQNKVQKMGSENQLLNRPLTPVHDVEASTSTLALNMKEKLNINPKGSRNVGKNGIRLGTTDVEVHCGPSVDFSHSYSNEVNKVVSDKAKANVTEFNTCLSNSQSQLHCFSSQETKYRPNTNLSSKTVHSGATYNSNIINSVCKPDLNSASNGTLCNGHTISEATSSNSLAAASDFSLSSDKSTSLDSSYSCSGARPRKRNTSNSSSQSMPHYSDCEVGLSFNISLNNTTSDSCKLGQGLIDENLSNPVPDYSLTSFIKEDVDNFNIIYVNYENENQMDAIMKLIQKDLSEPYSIYTYRYFIHNWPKLCFLAMHKNEVVGAIVCKLDVHKKVTVRGYIAMLAVDESYRKRRIGSNLVQRAIREMTADDADEVVLETEITNKSALQLYENLGFVRDKRLFRYYLNGVDALRLKLWLR